jgi:hypothetical protein
MRGMAFVFLLILLAGCSGSSDCDPGTASQHPSESLVDQDYSYDWSYEYAPSDADDASHGGANDGGELSPEEEGIIIEWGDEDSGTKRDSGGNFECDWTYESYRCRQEPLADQLLIEGMREVLVAQSPMYVVGEEMPGELRLDTTFGTVLVDAVVDQVHANGTVLIVITGVTGDFLERVPFALNNRDGQFSAGASTIGPSMSGRSTLRFPIREGDSFQMVYDDRGMGIDSCTGIRRTTHREQADFPGAAFTYVCTNPEIPGSIRIYMDPHWKWLIGFELLQNMTAALGRRSLFLYV